LILAYQKTFRWRKPNSHTANMKPALFLDRDGVINVDHAYVHRKEDFHFIDGIFELVAAAKQAGYLVVIVTNQAGIGRGYYSEEQFHHLMDWVKEQFAMRGGKIDGVYYCPYHRENGIGAYRKQSIQRKPRPGMLIDAQRDLDIDMEKSILVGDKSSDIHAGIAASVKTLLYLGEGPTPSAAKRIFDLSEVRNIFTKQDSSPIS